MYNNDSKMLIATIKVRETQEKKQIAVEAATVTFSGIKLLK